MAKLVVLVLSGPEDRRKVMTGLMFAKMAKESGELEDVRLIVSAQAVDIFKDEAFKNLIQEVNASVSMKACKMNAEGAGVADDVAASGVPLAPVGKELIDFINEGYEVISF
jgi:hypothetical protein